MSVPLPPIQTHSKLDYRIIFRKFEKTKCCTLDRQLALTELYNALILEPNTCKVGYSKCVEKTIQWYERNRAIMMKAGDYETLAQLGHICGNVGKFEYTHDIYNYLMESKPILDNTLSYGAKICDFLVSYSGAHDKDPKLILPFFKEQSGYTYAICLGQVGKTLHKMTRHKEAIELLEQAEEELKKPMPMLGQYTDNMKAMDRFNNGLVLGDAYCNLGCYPKAIKTYEQALENGKLIDEHHWQHVLTLFDILNHKGMAHQCLGDNKSAHLMFKAFLDLPKTNATAKQIIKTEPEYKEKYKEVLNLFSQCDFQEKEQDTDNPIEERVDDIANAEIKYAEKLILEQKPKEALVYIERALLKKSNLYEELTPVDLMNLYHLKGQANVDLDRHIDAALDYKAIVDRCETDKKMELFMNPSVIQWRQGKAFYNAGYYSEAKSVLKVACKNLPSLYRTAEAFYYIGLSYLALQRNSHAIEYIQRGFVPLGQCGLPECESLKWKFDLSLANCYLRKKEVSEARKILSKLQNTEDTETKMKALEMDGHCLMSLKRYRKGIENLEIAREYYQTQNTALQITLSIAKYSKQFGDTEKYKQATKDGLTSKKWKKMTQWKDPDREAIKLYCESAKAKNVIFCNSLLICGAFKYRKKLS